MPTFGKLTDGAGSSTSSANKTAVSSTTAPANGVAESGSARLWVDSGTTLAKFVIYADSAGAPGAKLAESEVTLSNTSEAQVDFTFSGANRISLVGGTTYWIGVAWQDPGTPNVNISRDATASARQENASYAPDPFGSPTAQAGPLDAFVTYSLPGGGQFFAFL